MSTHTHVPNFRFHSITDTHTHTHTCVCTGPALLSGGHDSHSDGLQQAPLVSALLGVAPAAEVGAVTQPALPQNVGGRVPDLGKAMLGDQYEVCLRQPQSHSRSTEMWLNDQPVLS